MSLSLTLTITKTYSSNRDRQLVFDERGGSVGRHPDNDFALPDPNHYLSRKHALISFKHDTFYITDTSENGVFLNHSNQPVGKNNTVPLNHGDCLGMGEYELDVSIGESNRAKIPERYETSPEVLGAKPIPSPSAWHAADKDEIARGILDGGNQPAEVPDYLYPDSQVLHAKADKQPAVEQDHSPAEQDFFWPPPMQKEDQERREEQQALKWDETSVGTVPDIESNRPDWDRTDYVAPVQTRDTKPEHSERSDHAGIHPPRRAYPREKTEFAKEQVEAAVYQSNERQHTTGDLDREPVSTGEPASPDVLSLEKNILHAFLQGAGLQIDQFSPEASEALMRLQGRLYREIVQGMMDVLRARFEVKDMIGAEQTRVQIRENNPLKFIGHVDDALEYLVYKRGSGYLGPEAAFRDAFQDIKDHQVAMVVGMRAALNSLLERFDPDRLEKRFVKGGKIDGLLPRYKRANSWQRYREWYADIVAAAEDDFQDLYGKEFRRAYEDQISRLSLLRRQTEK